jgi:type I restriction enzyme S subunit
MKQGWEIKTVGAICDIKTGRLDANAASENGAYPFFTCSQTPLRIDNYAYDCECVLVAGNGELNAKYYKGKFNAYQRTYIITTKLEYKDISVKYLYKFFSKYIEQLRQLSIGGVIKYIKLGNLTDAKLPIPPLAEQERIVAELDCLNGVIEKKKQQLKELDTLAQSIFYQMFGDPISNEKGWEVIHLKEAASLKAGKTIKANELSEEPKESLYPCFGGNGIRGYINKKSHYGQFPIIGRQGALCGNVVFAQGEFYATEHAVVCNNIISSINPLWLYYALKYNNLNRFAQGVAQPGISVNIINEMPLIYPPHSLQQEFAEKIEAIEKQKELIKQSIKETETLFNARMDYYFN